jgi:hypothetical protein
LPGPWPRFTWDERVRQYRGADGRLVSRTLVRQALDEAIEQARGSIIRDLKLMQLGAINLPEWQIRTEKALKTIHVMSAAVAAGGWAQATAADWSVAANRVRAVYVQIEKLARRLESGEYGLDDGRLAPWLASLGGWGSGTYETVLRRRDLATGRVVAERRLLHSGAPCKPCLAYHAMGWQPPRVLPDIGTECLCRKYCRCTFQRRFATAGRGQADLTDQPRPRPRRPIVGVPGIAARRRPRA